MVIDPIPADAIPDRLPALSGAGGEPGDFLAQPLSLLVDLAQAPELNLFAPGPGEPPESYNLYAHLGGPHARYAPWLVKLPENRPQRTWRLTRLIEQCNGRPMLSLLASPLSTRELAAHLARQVEVVLPPDGRRHLLRFADTRILPLLARLLSQDQQRRLFGPVTQWVYLDREGQWATIPGPGLEPHPVEPPLELTAEQRDAFLDASLPDNLLARLGDEFEWPASLPPSARHRLVCHWIEQARAEDGGQADPGLCLDHCRNALAALG